MMANIAPIKASSMMSPVSEAKITCTPLAWVIGVTAWTMSSSASKIRPRPIPTRPSCPARDCLRPRKKMTPIKISSGDNQDRSKVRIRAINAVPTSAPNTITRAGVRATRSWATKEVTSMVVALLLCTSAVTPMPAQKASGFFSTLRLRTVRRRAPKTRITPVRTMWVPQTSRATAESRCNSVNTEWGSPYRYCFPEAICAVLPDGAVLIRPTGKA